MSRRYKLFSDPVHGFIPVPKGLILDLIQTPEFQRLRRIRQLGVGYLVFPGAEHTRFGHALGAMFLMQEALQSLSDKGTPIAPDEYEAALIAALLHDIGHGPFSHSLEEYLIRDFEHESMSRALIVELDERFDNRLRLALDIFDGTYPRPFFHQLVSSQLDMDRLDYLRRDSFFTGVAEGVVGVDRIIKTLRVDPLDGGSEAILGIDEKGSYAVESFLLSRRLMYWQVYLHKTVLAGDQLLRSVIARARALLESGAPLPATSPAFLFFLENTITAADVDRPEVIEQFSCLDDADVLFSLKQWTRAADPILADLSRRFVNRDFFRVTFLDAPADAAALAAWHAEVRAWMRETGLDDDADTHDSSYYLAHETTRHAAYAPLRDSIQVLNRDGSRSELSAFSEVSSVSAMARVVVKPYICHPKEVALSPAPTLTPTIDA